MVMELLSAATTAAGALISSIDRGVDGSAHTLPIALQVALVEYGRTWPWLGVREHQQHSRQSTFASDAREMSGCLWFIRTRTIRSTMFG